MRPVILSGFMGTGKTTVGPRLASRLGVPFIDTDDVIAQEAGRSVPDLWRAHGEPAFRATEETSSSSASWPTLPRASSPSAAGRSPSRARDGSRSTARSSSR